MKKVIGFGISFGVVAGFVVAIAAQCVPGGTYAAWILIVCIILGGANCIIFSQKRIAKLPSVVTALIAILAFTASFWVILVLMTMIISGPDDLSGANVVTLISFGGAVGGFAYWDLRYARLSLS